MNSTQAVISSASPTRTPANDLLPVQHQQQTDTKESLCQLPIQRKLSVGAADDPLEKEADDMADKVMRMPMPEPISFSTSKNVINRKCPECEKEEELQRKESNSETLDDKVMQMPNPEPIRFSGSENVINRKCSECEKEEEALQRKESNGQTVSAVPSIVQNVLSSPGRSLDTDTRSFMEPRFNYDFSNVKIHDNDLAAKSASSINALAYTSGNNIVFNSGQYNTNSDPGKRLLAHELTHVVQQGQGDPHRKNIARKFISTIQSATPTIQRFFYVEGGAVHEVNNLARTVLYREDMGSTFALLNGIRIRQSADAKRALKKPTLDFSPVTTGGFDVRVKNVPVNKGSYDETVLSPGNWRLNVSKSTVFSKFPNLESCRNSGRTIFSALGYPSDIEIFQANRRHEDRHANDIAIAIHARTGTRNPITGF